MCYNVVNKLNHKYMDKITPIDVREALVNCFYQAHCSDTGLEINEETGRRYCLIKVKEVFVKQGVDFENPTKEGLLKVVNDLAEFSKNFRSQEIIEQHKKQITDLLSQLED